MFVVRRCFAAVWVFGGLVWLSGVVAAAEPAASPDWAKIDAPPVFTFAWITDPHLNDRQMKHETNAMRFVNENLKPDFVLITGDNSYCMAPTRRAKEPESIGLRRQRFFAQYLKTHLDAPVVVIPGDNEPEDFDRVFGAKQYSFDYCGLHFVMLSPDRGYKGANTEGLSAMDQSTMDWFHRDLEQNRDKPSLFVIHEPICPPTFLDAKRVRAEIDSHPNVLASFQGHLHVDMETRRNGQAYFVSPALTTEKSNPTAMKQVLVYPHIIVLRTIHCDRQSEQFRFADVWQKIDVPERYRAGIKRSGGSKFVQGNPSEVPPHPYVNDPKLGPRKTELFLTIGPGLLHDLGASLGSTPHERKASELRDQKPEGESRQN
jgi:hypothetical protein